MFFLRRQWHRARLAHELLLRHEQEERDLMPVSEAMRLLRSFPTAGLHLERRGSTRWDEAARAKAEQYPSDA